MLKSGHHLFPASLLLVAAAAAMAAQPVETILKGFALAPPRGDFPQSGVISNGNGTLYGTTATGGLSSATYYGGAGIVFALNPGGKEMVLHEFTGLADGGSPTGSLSHDAAGNFYGTTRTGGNIKACKSPYTGFPPGCGVIFKIDTAGQYSILYTFSGTEGQNAQGVTPDAAGNLYGTVSEGSTPGFLFKVDTAGHEKVLHTFTGGADGESPNGGIAIDASGSLFGTTYAGGAYNDGVVYKIDSQGNETVLYHFAGGEDGENPSGGLALDPAGNLYGTTPSGGTANDGVVFRIDVTGAETLLYNFTGNTDGGDPQSGVVLDAAGNVYGTTYFGGSSEEGVVYVVNAAGQETVLHNFTGGTDGGFPAAGVFLDKKGSIYGTTNNGGRYEDGEVYELDAAGQETTLLNFTHELGGVNPGGGLVLDASGNLYGPAYGGPGTYGVIFKLSPAGVETELYSFTAGAAGGQPRGPLLRDTGGSIYGAAASNGVIGPGLIYTIDASGEESVLYSFTGGDDGSSPNGGLIRDKNGNLVGTTFSGGYAFSGVVFRLSASGLMTTLYSFSGGADGETPSSGVIEDAAGTLYGTAALGGTSGLGVVYSIDATGHFQVLHSFSGPDGSTPEGGVYLDAQGNLYGTTQLGGTYNFGVVYKLNTSGQQTVLYNFAGGADGGQPVSGVIRDAAGSLYGTTSYGGNIAGCLYQSPVPGCGVVFALDAENHERVLHAFKGGTDGAEPSSGVIADPAGNLFGMTSWGGKYSGGVVYEIERADMQ